MGDVEAAPWFEGVVLEVPDATERLAIAERAQQYVILAYHSANRQLSSGALLEKIGFRTREGPELDEPTMTDIREDLLRSALVFACAGLDASVKALIEDTYRALANLDRHVEDNLARFAERYLSDGSGIGVRALVSVLADPFSPRDAIIQAFVRDLTGDSLQSVEQLYRVGAAFRIGTEFIKEKENVLREAFRARNQIVHELDLVATPGRTFSRRSRAMDEIRDEVGTVIHTAQSIVSEVSKALSEASSLDLWPLETVAEQSQREPD